MRGVPIMRDGSLVDFMEWCRNNSVPVVWMIDADGPKRFSYFGARNILKHAKAGVSFGSPSLSVFLIRESDYVLVKLQGNIVRIRAE